MYNRDMEIIDTGDYLTVQQAARELSVTDAAVRGAILKNRLKSVLLYGRKLIPRSELSAYKHRTQPDGVKPTGRPRRVTERGPALSTFTTLGAEASLREIWDNPEEDEAWRDL